MPVISATRADRAAIRSRSPATPGPPPHDRHAERNGGGHDHCDRRAVPHRRGTIGATDDDRSGREQAKHAAQQPAVADSDLAPAGRDPQEHSPPTDHCNRNDAASNRIMAHAEYGSDPAHPQPAADALAGDDPPSHEAPSRPRTATSSRESQPGGIERQARANPCQDGSP